MNQSTMSAYRADIDGLRAIAVLSVIIFHIEKDWLPGGFVGVDIFFVLSGYLISLYIFQKILDNSFSLAEFYRRRIKRIAPAMLVVLVVVLIVAQLVMLPEDALKTSESVIWSLLSVTNIYFYFSQDVSYFASAMNEKPLLHFWSLGVEEQFYLFWPLILMAIYRLLNARHFLYFLIFISACSFVSAQYYYHISPSFVYYMLPTRAGELLIGAIVAHIILHRKSTTLAGADAISLFGAILIILSFIFISEEDIFPGFIALLPTIGTACIIYSGQYKVTWLARVLMAKPLVAIGLISYSAYLWHWPIIAFFRYGLFESTWISFSFLLCSSLLLGWASFQFIEKPFRYTSWSFKKVLVKQYLVPSGSLFAFALLCIFLGGYGVRGFSDSYQKALTEIRSSALPAYSYKYVCQKGKISTKDFTSEACIVGAKSSENHPQKEKNSAIKNQAPSAILIGDSNAAHYVGMVGAFAQKQGFTFRNLQISACPPVIEKVEKYASRKYLANCRASLKRLWPMLKEYKVIIVSASWLNYQNRSAGFLVSFYKTVNSLTNNSQEVIILGKAPVIPSYNQDCLARSLSFPFIKCNESLTYLDSKIEEINLALLKFSQLTERVEYFDANDFLCRNKNCSAYNKNGKPMYFDTSHLSIPGSWQLGKDIIRHEGVPYPFNLIGE